MSQENQPICTRAQLLLDTQAQQSFLFDVWSQRKYLTRLQVHFGVWRRSKFDADRFAHRQALVSQRKTPQELPEADKPYHEVLPPSADQPSGGDSFAFGILTARSSADY